MAAQMLSRRGQRLSQWRRPSLAGRTAAERLRTTAFAALGLATAMGLGLVALLAHQSWPDLPSDPLPRGEAGKGGIHKAVAMVPFANEPGLAAGKVRAGGAGARVRNGGARMATHESRLWASHRVTSQATAPDPELAQPGDVGAPPSAPATAAPTPVQAPAPPVPPATSSPSAPKSSPPPAPEPEAAAASGPGKGHAYGREKAGAAPKPKSSRPVPAADPASPEPPVSPAPPPPDDSPAAAGHGNGHAYGRDR